MSKSIYGIGIDLGGTNLRIALVSRAGDISFRNEVPVANEKTPQNVLEQMHGLISDLKSNVSSDIEIVGIGVAAPGGIDTHRGLVTQSPHFPLWQDVPIKTMLKEKVSRPVFLDNDANCFVLGEQSFGAGKGHKNVIGLTLGTGLGGGLVFNEKLWHGDTGMAGELGHMVIQENGLPCACGGRGCFEVYASGTALIRMAKEELGKGTSTVLKNAQNINGEALEMAAKQKDPLALKVFQRMGGYLGKGIASLTNITGISHVILGGKVSRSWPFYASIVQEKINEQCFRRVAEQIEIQIAKCGDDAGLLGAAALTWKNL